MSGEQVLRALVIKQASGLSVQREHLMACGLRSAIATLTGMERGRRRRRLRIS
jgi:hypothetical protein